jgi:hypothetical protein
MSLDALKDKIADFAACVIAGKETPVANVHAGLPLYEKHMLCLQALYE